MTVLPIIFYIILYIVLILLIIGLLKGKEFFGPIKYTRAANTEFRGINLLGENSEDGHFACENEAICQLVCDRNPECKGYSFYKPGQRCYMFMSGNFVPERPGFFSGKKIE